MEEWCSKYDKETVDGLNMLFRKDTQEVIVTVRELIRKCLNCKFFIDKCDQSNSLISFLWKNDR